MENEFINGLYRPSESLLNLLPPSSPTLWPVVEVYETMVTCGRLGLPGTPGRRCPQHGDGCGNTLAGGVLVISASGQPPPVSPPGLTPAQPIHTVSVALITHCSQIRSQTGRLWECGCVWGWLGVTMQERLEETIRRMARGSSVLWSFACRLSLLSYTWLLLPIGSSHQRANCVPWCANINVHRVRLRH